MGVAKDKISTAWKHSSLWLHKKFVHFVALLSRFLVKSGISELQHSANDTLKNDELLHFHFRPVATYHCFWKSIWGYFASNDMISKRIYLVKCQLSSMFLKNNQCTIKIVAVAVHIFFFSENLSFAPPKTIHQHLVILEKKRCSCSLPGPVDDWDLSQPIFFKNGFSIYRFVIKSVNCNSLAPFFMKQLCTFEFRSNQL